MNAERPQTLARIVGWMAPFVVLPCGYGHVANGTSLVSHSSTDLIMLGKIASVPGGGMGHGPPRDDLRLDGRRGDGRRTAGLAHAVVGYIHIHCCRVRHSKMDFSLLRVGRLPFFPSELVQSAFQ